MVIRVKDNLLVIRMNVCYLTQWGGSWGMERVCKRGEIRKNCGNRWKKSEAPTLPRMSGESAHDLFATGRARLNSLWSRQGSVLRRRLCKQGSRACGTLGQCEKGAA